MSDPAPTSARNAVVAAALDLFATHGFEATSVEQIAQAAGVSRSTFFRQFGGKDDVVFSDHDVLLAQLREFLAVAGREPHENPWAAACAASVEVFRHFAAEPELARRRYAVVRQVPALREREIVTVFQYERLFDEYLRSALPGLDPVDAVAFSAAVTAVHNHVLRRLLRGTEDIPESVLTDAYDRLMHRFGVHPGGDEAQEDDLVVAVFPRRMPGAEVARRLRESL
ncbi:MULTISPECIES: TetR/AcrR family transcriptional regulator [Microbacterium]|uniref:TetR/AcrR family transcriptional regulator n=1 Tax=Microbacterium TaxID=33882 RepID=UPI001991C671|nr:MULTISPECIES: TetR/AcrR family transcriptional regulator [Microbacterium]MBD3757484.1 TetR family transcriptional regulator [Microbacterium sp.]MCG7413562.1 TetR/AcrR family transcriptional regulator [Microbacterium aurum]